MTGPTELEVWRPVRYAPILYPLLWIAAIVVALTPMRIALGGLWGITWHVSSIGCPPLFGLAWWLIVKRSGRARYLGYGLRLAADFGQLAVLAAFDVSGFYAELPFTDYRIFGQAGFLSIAVFLAALVRRDIRDLSRVERRAWRIRRDA